MIKDFFNLPMHPEFNIPPKSKYSLTPPDVLAKRFQSLIGTPFPLVRQARTDGSRVRKLIAKTLENYPLPPLSNSYSIVNPKGLPGILREYLDTYIITSGERSYNLQVWNRNPASKSVQIEYSTGEPLSANDVRFVCVRVNTEKYNISSILILSPEYITGHFGSFGKPTKKYQLIIAPKTREQIQRSSFPLIFYPDTPEFATKVTHTELSPRYSFRNPPVMGEVMALETLRDKLFPKLIGTRLNTGATKNRGQALEMLVAQILGYSITSGELLIGDYPDIPNQVLEVKVQDSPTVDLGKFTPEFEESIPFCLGATTRDVRYLIALTDNTTNTITGLILCPGARLGDHFSYVADQNYKCQRSIPLSFFDEHDGRSLFNP